LVSFLPLTVEKEIGMMISESMAELLAHLFHWRDRGKSASRGH
jgi:hypothetical protein